MAKKVIKTFNVGSPSYMSPEAYQRTLYSEKSDSWALGMTLYEMLHGETLDSNIETKTYF
jgi:serine/threonine protein kinase